MHVKNKLGKIINISKNDKQYFHIYFNDSNKEIKINRFSTKNFKIDKIKILIDYQVESFENLFKYCYNIESISFKKFLRTNINNMRRIFCGYSSLK